MLMFCIGKYRPNVPYKGHYKEWWHFAYKCILVGEVQRNRNNWNWHHMLAHRNMGREYGELLRKNVKNAVGIAYSYFNVLLTICGSVQLQKKYV